MRVNFDTTAAGQRARLLARFKNQGSAMPVKESQIAATAFGHGLTVATRNSQETGGVRRAWFANLLL